MVDADIERRLLRLVYGHLKSLDNFRQYARETLAVLESVNGDRPPSE